MGLIRSEALQHRSPAVRGGTSSQALPPCASASADAGSLAGLTHSPWAEWGVKRVPRRELQFERLTRELEAERQIVANQLERCRLEAESPGAASGSKQTAPLPQSPPAPTTASRQPLSHNPLLPRLQQAVSPSPTIPSCPDYSKQTAPLPQSPPAPTTASRQPLSHNPLLLRLQQADSPSPTIPSCPDYSKQTAPLPQSPPAPTTASRQPLSHNPLLLRLQQADSPSPTIPSCPDYSKQTAPLPQSPPAPTTASRQPLSHNPLLLRLQQADSPSPTIPSCPDYSKQTAPLPQSPPAPTTASRQPLSHNPLLPRLQQADSPSPTIPSCPDYSKQTAPLPQSPPAPTTASRQPLSHNPLLPRLQQADSPSPTIPSCSDYSKQTAPLPQSPPAPTTASRQPLSHNPLLPRLQQADSPSPTIPSCPDYSKQTAPLPQSPPAPTTASRQPLSHNPLLLRLQQADSPSPTISSCSDYSKQTAPLPQSPPAPTAASRQPLSHNPLLPRLQQADSPSPTIPSCPDCSKQTAPLLTPPRSLPVLRASCFCLSTHAYPRSHLRSLLRIPSHRSELLTGFNLDVASSSEKSLPWRPADASTNARSRVTDSSQSAAFRTGAEAEQPALGSAGRSSLLEREGPPADDSSRGRSAPRGRVRLQPCVRAARETSRVVLPGSVGNSHSSTQMNSYADSGYQDAGSYYSSQTLGKVEVRLQPSYPATGVATGGSLLRSSRAEGQASGQMSGVAGGAIPGRAMRRVGSVPSRTQSPAYSCGISPSRGSLRASPGSTYSSPIVTEPKPLSSIFSSTTLPGPQRASSPYTAQKGSPATLRRMGSASRATSPYAGRMGSPLSAASGEAQAGSGSSLGRPGMMAVPQHYGATLPRTLLRDAPEPYGAHSYEIYERVVPRPDSLTGMSRGLPTSVPAYSSYAGLRASFASQHSHHGTDLRSAVSPERHIGPIYEDRTLQGPLYHSPSHVSHTALYRSSSEREKGADRQTAHMTDGHAERARERQAKIKYIRVMPEEEEMMEKCRQGQEELHRVFVDPEKAHETVASEKPWYRTRKSGVAEKYVTVVQEMCEKSVRAVGCVGDKVRETRLRRFGQVGCTGDKVRETRLRRFGQVGCIGDKVRETRLRRFGQVGCVGDKVRETRLRRFGQVRRREEGVQAGAAKQEEEKSKTREDVYGCNEGGHESGWSDRGGGVGNLQRSSSQRSNMTYQRSSSYALSGAAPYTEPYRAGTYRPPEGGYARQVVTMADGAARSPSIDSIQKDPREFAWRDPELPEVIHMLQHQFPSVQANAAAYLQHLCFGDNRTKAEVCRLNGIKHLVDLLDHKVLEVQRNACGALRNLVYGKADDNKIAVRNAGGVPALLRLLRKTVDAEVREVITVSVPSHVTWFACNQPEQLSSAPQRNPWHPDREPLGISARCNWEMSSAPRALSLHSLFTDAGRGASSPRVLWNLSSCDAVKMTIVHDALTTLTNTVIIPHSGWSNSSYDDDHKLKFHSSLVLRNTTGCLRNLSSAGEEARKQLRCCDGLVDSLLYVIKACVSTSDFDSKIVENCICTLRNLSYRLELEIPPSRLITTEEVDGSLGSESPSKEADYSCWGRKRKKKRKSIKEEQWDGVGPIPGFSKSPKGAEMLWHPAVVKPYLTLLAESSNPATLEGAAGSLQNLSAGHWKFSAYIRGAVRKEKGLPILVELLRMDNDRVVCSVATALRNMALDVRNKELIGKYAMRDLVNRLPGGSTTLLSDETVAAICCTLHEVSSRNMENAKALADTGGIEKLINITKGRGDRYSMKVVKAAAQVLNTLWQYRDLRTIYKKDGWNQNHFLTPVSTLERDRFKSQPTLPSTSIQMSPVHQTTVSVTSSPAVLGIKEQCSDYQRTQPSMQFYNYQGDSVHKTPYTGSVKASPFYISSYSSPSREESRRAQHMYYGDEGGARNYEQYRMYLQSPQGYEEPYLEQAVQYSTADYTTQPHALKTTTNYVDFYSTTRRASYRTEQYPGSPDSWV
ncbi:hypothetical protein P4O66_015021 [Electrophorus voltai]|uniref:Plakophilin 4 n=1 Tax=Electrophorus voltai TaxID=2609070 RepID=A0AAD8Z026_9TELE|nr:hypothetical protein P4O66_015021 [Electrophorus voltai]